MAHCACRLQQYGEHGIGKPDVSLHNAGEIYSWPTRCTTVGDSRWLPIVLRLPRSVHQPCGRSSESAESEVVTVLGRTIWCVLGFTNMRVTGSPWFPSRIACLPARLVRMCPLRRK